MGFVYCHLRIICRRPHRVKRRCENFNSVPSEKVVNIFASLFPLFHAAREPLTQKRKRIRQKFHSKLVLFSRRFLCLARVFPFALFRKNPQKFFCLIFTEFSCFFHSFSFFAKNHSALFPIFPKMQHAPTEGLQTWDISESMKICKHFSTLSPSCFHFFTEKTVLFCKDFPVLIFVLLICPFLPECKRSRQIPKTSNRWPKATCLK